MASNNERIARIDAKLTCIKDVLVCASNGPGQHGAFSEPWHGAIHSCDTAKKLLLEMLAERKERDGK